MNFLINKINRRSWWVVKNFDRGSLNGEAIICSFGSDLHGLLFKDHHGQSNSIVDEKGCIYTLLFIWCTVIFFSQIQKMWLNVF